MQSPAPPALRHTTRLRSSRTLFFATSLIVTVTCGMMLAIATDGPGDEKHRDDGEDSIGSSDDAHQLVPVAAEDVTHSRNHRNPGGCAQKVEQEEALPRHVQDAGQRPCDDAKSKDEAGKENGNGAGSREETFPGAHDG